MTLTFDRAAEATNAEIRGRERAPETLRVVTDTRSLEPGDTFLALRGERFDGHDFVGEALKKGAAALVLDSPRAETDGAPTLIVRDTRRAYMDLAAALCDRLAVMSQGRLLKVDRSQAIFADDALLAAARLRPPETQALQAWLDARPS